MKKLLIAYGVISCILSSDERCKFVNEHLNSWQWPFHFFCDYFTKLKNFTEDKYTTTKYVINMPIMAYIKNRLGDKQLLRYHNSDMSDEKFEDWWRLCHGCKTDAQYNEFYAKYPLK